MRTIKACEVMLSLIILFLFQWAVEAKNREPSLLGAVQQSKVPVLPNG